jgi:peptide deformylase
MRRALPLLLLPLLVAGCVKRAPTPSYEVPSFLLPLEEYLVMAGAVHDPLELVTNDSVAGDRFLRVPAAVVDPADPSLPHLVQRMRASLELAEGVGIAAPQVGVGRRVILVMRQDLEGEPIEEYLNPVIESYSEAEVLGWEGCLSIPEGLGEVLRPDGIVVTFEQLGGVAGREEVLGWTARIFQHEIDHLDGVLFIDRMPDPTLTPTEEYRAMREAERAAEQGDSAAEPEVEQPPDVAPEP